MSVLVILFSSGHKLERNLPESVCQDILSACEDHMNNREKIDDTSFGKVCYHEYHLCVDLTQVEAIYWN